MLLGTAQRVAHGARQLDLATPDWEGRIDLRRLAISSPEHCVLAQVYGRMSFVPDPVEASSEEGMVHSWWFPLAILEYGLLTWAWKREIKRRRSRELQIR